MGTGTLNKVRDDKLMKQFDLLKKYHAQASDDALRH